MGQPDQEDRDQAERIVPGLRKRAPVMAANIRGIDRNNPVPGRLSPQVQARFQQALALHQRGRISQAQAIYGEILKVQPRHFDTLHLLGVAAVQSGELERGIRLIGDAISVNPDVAAAHNNLGAALKDLNRLGEAVASFDKALMLQPNYPEACNNRGNALRGLRRPEEALGSYDRALSLKADYAEALNGRGNALLDLRRPDEALASYDKALSLKPDYANAHNNRGTALKDLKRLDEALASYDRALSLNPDNAEVYNHRGNVLKDLKRLDEALASYSKALSLKSDYELLRGIILHTRMKLCAWDGFSESLRHYEADIADSNRVTMPFPALSLLDEPELHRKAAEVYVRARYPKSQVLGEIARRPANGRIRVGYYSADFRNHPVAYLLAELFESHNREKFEIFGFSFGPDSVDEMRQRLSSSFTRFVDVRNMSDRGVAKLSRELGVDIAVDLAGYTLESRPGMFAEGCAPIQISYIGYLGTMGSDRIDYVIADKTVIPVQSQPHFTEKIAYLPHCFQANDSKRRISDREFTRQELDLPETGFVFCCFNQSYKILPPTFSSWMRLLKAVEGSVLWLYADNPTAIRNLRKEAESRGVEGRRLVFAKHLKYDEYLARYGSADLFLDTLPYNAGTTASDALWAGLPVLTCMGRSFAGRMAASLLRTVDLPDLITLTQEEYEAKAIGLALNRDKLRELRSRLAKNRLITPLFNGRLFARHIESAYATMHARYQAGLEPASFEVQA